MPPEFRRLLETGESQLAAGNAEAARVSFEAATLLAHEPDAELSLVRAYMQAGEYRRALAFCAHAAGAHPDTPGGMALYAWLLHAGGQERVAARTLEQALARAPGDSALIAAHAGLSGAWPEVSGRLAERPWRAAPYAWPLPVSDDARVQGSGVLVGTGGRVLVPSALLGQARKIWVRNGLGQTSAATIVEPAGASGMTLLHLDQPLRRPAARLIIAPEPFGGSPAYMAEFSPGRGDQAAWPLLRQGFFGRVPRDDGPRPLGIEAPRGPRGGPVFDAAGRLVGMAIVDGQGLDRFMPAARLDGLTGDASAQAEPGGPRQRMAIDEIYERVLSTVVQVIVAH